MPLNGNKNLSPLLKQDKNALIKQYEREVILAKREEDIQQKEALITKREQDIQQKANDLSKKQEDLKKMEALLIEREKALSEKEKIINLNSKKEDAD